MFYMRVKHSFAQQHLLAFLFLMREIHVMLLDELQVVSENMIMFCSESTHDHKWFPQLSSAFTCERNLKLYAICVPLWQLLLNVCGLKIKTTLPQLHAASS